jgi:hypothetical protein
VDGAHTQRCRLRYYNRDAIEVQQGTVERRIDLEGFETVEAEGVEYAGCLRLKVETKFRIDRGPRVDATEYVWLAADVGEVRRVEHVSGIAWPVYFNQIHTYELLRDPATPRPQPSAARLVGDRPPILQAWSRCAVFLDRLLPRPRLGGLAAEFAPAHSVSPIAVAASRLD